MGNNSQNQAHDAAATPGQTLMEGLREAGTPAFVTTGYLASLLLLGPLKMGTSLNNTGIAFFPLSGIEWQIGAWPPSIMPVLCGIGLLLVLLEAPPDLRALRALPHAWLPPTILVVAAGIGLIQTTELDFALGFLWHMTGVLVMGLAVLLHLAVLPKSRWIFLGAIVLGVIFSGLQGWYQVFWGFDENRQQILEMAQRGEVMTNSAILNKLDQRRAFANFTYPNNYAAHLLLTIPLALYLVWRGARHVSPPLFSQLLLTSLTAIITIGAFLHAGSRAAIVALALGSAATVVAYGCRYRRWLLRHLFIVVWAGIFAVLVLTFLYFFVQQGRSLSSLAARGDYYRSAWLMFLQAPLTGLGMGEFFPWHLRLKPPGAEETRLVHNFFLHFLSQAGIVGGLGALYFLLMPILIWYRSLRRKQELVSTGLWIAIFVGWLSWAAHAMADFNLHIPGTMLTVVCLPVLGVKLSLDPEKKPIGLRLGWRVLFGALALFSIAVVWRWPGEKAYQAYYNDLMRPQMVETRAQAAAEVAEANPFSPYPWDWLGKDALRQKNYELAARAFTEAVKRTPHRAAYHAYLAEALWAMGETEKARESIEQALTWYPHKAKYQALANEMKASRP